MSCIGCGEDHDDRNKTTIPSGVVVTNYNVCPCCVHGTYNHGFDGCTHSDCKCIYQSGQLLLRKALHQ